MSRWRAGARLLGGAAVIGLVLWRVGGDAFARGIAVLDGPSLVAPVVLGAITTMASAWRWRLVAHGLGISLDRRSAVAGYYRSQFLNTVLPGGILGDVQRGATSGRSGGDVGRGLRAVAWERIAGQVVQVVLTVLALLVLPSSVRAASLVVALVAAGVAVAVLPLVVRPHGGTSRWARATRTAANDLRVGLLSRRIWPGVVAASVVVVAGHATTFVLAARTAGLDASPTRLLPLVLLALLAMSLPLNVGGWGPREGVAAWTFAAAGLGAAAGVTTAVVYGVMVFVACLPGALAPLLLRPARGTGPAAVGGVAHG